MKVNLCDICDFQGGSQPPKSQWTTLQQDGYIRMLQIRDFTQPGKVKAEYVKLTNTTKCCLKDDILIARYGASLGKILTGLSGAYNVAMTKAVPNEAIISKKFLYYFLCSDTFQNCILNVGVRAAQAGFNKEDLSNIELYCPDLSIQNKMCKILESVDVLIIKSKLQLDKLDLLVKSRFIEMFGDPIVNPKGWSQEKLVKRCNIITGNTPSRTNLHYYGDYIEWIKSDNITGNLILTKASEFLSEEGLNVGRSVDKDSILMTCIAGSLKSIGNVAIANRKVAFNQQINAIVTNKEETYFMYEQFKLAKTYLTSDINMSLKGILNKSQLGNKKFIFPPLVLQKEFANFFAQVDKSKLAIQQSLDELETLKKSLMQQYFG